VSGFSDLHCHWVPGIDDGAPSLVDGLAMLRGLRDLGFEHVVATPHMRPGLFDNQRSDFEAAYGAALFEVERAADLPHVSVASEHYFDDVVFGRLMRGEGLPYPGDRAVLLEFYELDLPQSIERLLAVLRERALIPVIAHPERYQAVWKDPSVLDRMLDAGAVALLDVAALVGKYGAQPQSMAEELLDRGCYYAACSDAHRPADIAQVKAGLDLIREHYGEDEVGLLFHDGPRDILAGTASSSR